MIMLKYLGSSDVNINTPTVVCSKKKKTNKNI